MFTLTKLSAQARTMFSAQARTMFSLDDQKGFIVKRQEPEPVSLREERGFTVPRVVILIVIIVVGAIAIGVYLLNNPQIFRSRAGTGVDWLNAFNITNASGQVLVCNNTQNPPICETNTLTVKVAVKDLSVLTKSVLAESTQSAVLPPPDLGDQGGVDDSEITALEASLIDLEAEPTPEPISVIVATGDDELDTEAPEASATATPSSAGSTVPTNGILSIKVKDQEIDFNTKNPVTVVLSSEEGAVSTPAEYDIPIVVTREDNSIQALVIKFNYQPRSSSGREASASALPAGSGSASASPRATAVASASATPKVASKYDLNGDGALNTFDIASFLQKWRGKNAADLRTIDFNNDGVVNIFDFSTMKGDLTSR